MGLKNSFRIAVFLLLSLQATAQQWPFELWHEGKIVLLEGDTLRGMLKYNLMKDLVEFSSHDTKPEVYTARKVVFFEIFDQTENKYRQFYALPFNASGEYKTPIFFELLADGKMTLLAREYLETRTISTSYYAGAYTRVVLMYHYFFIDEKGEISQFTGTRHDLLNQMGNQADAVEKYIRSNRLDIDNKQDLSRVIVYYNSLTKI
jgi:hypothetical protein